MKVSLLALTFGFFLVVGLPLAASAGPTDDTSPDADSDGVADHFDNCKNTANPGQEDADHDGCGDACDLLADFNEDGIVDGFDFGTLSSSWQTTGNTKATGDSNGDGLVDGFDFGDLSSEWQQSIGTSGVPNVIAPCGP